MRNMFKIYSSNILSFVADVWFEGVSISFYCCDSTLC